MLSASAFSPIASFASLAAPRFDEAGTCGAQGRRPLTLRSAPVGAPLASLAGGALARRFYGWRGVSGRRYVATIHAATDESWIDVEGAVALMVEIDLDGRRRLIAVEAAPTLERRMVLQEAARRREGRGIRVEAHLHLLAETDAARAAAAADLAPLTQTSNFPRAD